MEKTFNFKNNYNVNVSMSVENYNNENIDPLIDFVKEFDDCIYWNDSECYHWMFDKKIDIPGYDDLWIENIELTNDLQNMKCLVVMK